MSLAYMLLFYYVDVTSMYVELNRIEYVQDFIC